MNAHQKAIQEAHKVYALSQTAVAGDERGSCGAVYKAVPLMRGAAGATHSPSHLHGATY